MIDLEAIRERWSRVTPGPWQHEACYESKIEGVSLATVCLDHDIIVPRNASPDTAAQSYADAEAIAHAPQDVADLLAEVERSRKLLSELGSAAHAALTELNRSDGEPRSVAIMLSSALNRVEK